MLRQTLLFVCVVGLAAGRVGRLAFDRPRAYAPWSGDLTDGWQLFDWLLTSWTEPEFYTCSAAGVGLLAGALFAQWAQAREKSWGGFVLACGSGLWPATAASSVLGLLLSNLLWGWTLQVAGVWQPTFVPVVSVAPTLVLLYGPGRRVIATGAVLAACVVTPCSVFATHFICRPAGLPLVIGVTGGMAVGALVAFALCRVLPWLPCPALGQGAEPDNSCGRQPADFGVFRMLRRGLADLSEAQFFGNEWASAGLILGAVLVVLVNPGVPVYGTRLLPQVLAAQAATAALGLVIWHHKWKKGFFPTFVPIVSVVPASVIAFDGSLLSIIGSAVLGTLVAPPLAAAISSRLPGDFHPFIGNVASMAISTALIVPLLRYVPGIQASP